MRWFSFALLACAAGGPAWSQSSLVAKYPPPERTELAGKSVVGYPFFQYTRTFQEGEPVSLAIDPSRFPNIANRSADVYVVLDKTATEWHANPALVDVGAGPALQAFSSMNIQANTFVIDTGTLSGLDGTAFGRGYDVVIDINQNAILDSGDFIDGRDDTGFWVVPDPTQAGPHGVASTTYSGGVFLGQRTYYPSDIASLGQLPLVVISHGNGHVYTWYDHIGDHLASWGYIVMSHENDTGPSSDAASLTTISNTDYILANQAVIQGGVLDGHIDSSRISFIGHSRGGEGVVRAYWRVANGLNVPTHYDADDIVFLSAIAPVTHISTGSTPDDKNFHLLYGSADDDVQGNPGFGSKAFAFYERSSGNKQSTYIHGAGHGYFNTGSGCVCSGPGLLTRAQVHAVMRGYYLPLLEHYVHDNDAAVDFLTRMYEDFHPQGIDPALVVAKDYRETVAAGNFVIDDYQTQPSTAVSSSGGAVSFDVTNVQEALMQDVDGSFDYHAGVPMNGMTRWKHAADDGQGVVFEWTTGATNFYELEIIPTERDMSDDAVLAFRAAQGTRHPETDALDAPLSFTVSLRDSAGMVSSISIANYGQITRTYKRTGWGAGAGWGNEFNTVHVRLRDFLTNGSALDLEDVVAVRFEFGIGFGSERGRLAMDDVEILKD